MIVEKVVENGNTYRVETNGATVVKMKVDPMLRYDEVPRTVNAGDVVTIAMRLEEFDGTRLHATMPVTLIVDREPATIELTGGAVTLELELTARGRHRIHLQPTALSMEPIEIDVV